jgi:hypothetical protein
MRYWINTISLNHVTKGAEGGFTQAGHGKRNALAKLSQGDRIIFYSPRESLAASSPPVQSFTAHGTVIDDAPYQAEITPHFKPFRRGMEFTPQFKIRKVGIRPLIAHLRFIEDKKHWGLVFRRGLFEIPEDDYNVIARKMGILDSKES